MSVCRVVFPPNPADPISQRPFALTPGDAPTLRFALVRPDSGPFNLSDYTIDFYIKRSLQDTEMFEFHGYSGFGVSLGGALKDGLIDVTVPADVTLGLRLHRPYPWYLRIAHQILLEKIYVPVRGTFLLALPST